MPEGLSGHGRPVGPQQIKSVIGVWEQQQRRLHTCPPQPFLHLDTWTWRDNDVIPALHQEGWWTAATHVRDRRKQRIPLGDLLRTAADDPVQPASRDFLEAKPFGVVTQQPPHQRRRRGIPVGPIRHHLRQRGVFVMLVARGKVHRAVPAQHATHRRIGVAHVRGRQLRMPSRVRGQEGNVAAG
jgi:hypothetical protein